MIAYALTCYVFCVLTQDPRDAQQPHPQGMRRRTGIDPFCPIVFVADWQTGVALVRIQGTTVEWDEYVPLHAYHKLHRLATLLSHRHHPLHLRRLTTCVFSACAIRGHLAHAPAQASPRPRRPPWAVSHLLNATFYRPYTLSVTGQFALARHCHDLLLSGVLSRAYAVGMTMNQFYATDRAVTLLVPLQLHSNANPEIVATKESSCCHVVVRFHRTCQHPLLCARGEHRIATANIPKCPWWQEVLRPFEARRPATSCWNKDSNPHTKHAHCLSVEVRLVKIAVVFIDPVFALVKDQCGHGLRQRSNA